MLSALSRSALKLLASSRPSSLLACTVMVYSPLISSSSPTRISRLGLRVRSSVSNAASMFLNRGMPFFRPGTSLQNIVLPSQRSPLNPRTPLSLANENPSPLWNPSPGSSVRIRISRPPDVCRRMLSILPTALPMDFAASAEAQPRLRFPSM